MTEVGGATAVGLRNPNSLTDAVGIYKKMLHPASPGTIPLIHLGEVDCGLVIWYRSQKYKESIMGQLEQSIAAYFQFVDDLITIGFASVVITGATLPTIRDGQDFGDVANARREIVATLVERTSLTLLYNKHLRAGAEARALPYIDISSKVLDIETGVVADFFRHP